MATKSRWENRNMTVRKFLRFFKHFPYYMKKDLRWLKKRLSRKSRTEECANGAPKLLMKALKKVKSETGSAYAIRYGSKYYVPFKNAPWDFCEVWRECDTVMVKIRGKGYATVICSNVDEDGVLGQWISELFTISDGSPAEMFAIRVKGLSNTSIVEEKRDGRSFYKLYVTSGSQRPRLTYTIDYIDKENGVYETHMRSSKGGVEITYGLPYFPMQVLKSIPIAKVE